VQVGLADIPLDAMMARFSGGERTRIGIAHLLIEAPDLLLLDEPSNNLDNAGRDALFRLIRNWSGGILVASHDRQLLEIMDRIVEITPVGVRLFSGGWSAFVEARDAERARFVANQERSEMQLRAARRHVQAQQEAKARRDSGGRADADRGSQPRILLGKRAQQAEESGARLRRVGAQQLAAASAALDESRQRLEIVTPLVMDVPPSAIPTGAAVLRLDGVIQALGARPLGPWTLHLRGPERVAVTGPNGAGKTSLLRIAYGSMPPGEGLARRAEGRVAMLDQHVALIDPTLSVVDNYRRLHPAADMQHAYAACARFAFRNDDARRVAGTLSGGERLRAGLACTLGAPVAPWLMLLDEPTNHLDLDSVAVLEGALNRYDGALLVVSHDREFLRAISIQREFHVDK
jgi:ATPase subunit of ABC transporter with duplicated ATPase domains